MPRVISKTGVSAPVSPLIRARFTITLAQLLNLFKIIKLRYLITIFFINFFLSTLSPFILRINLRERVHATYITYFATHITLHLNVKRTNRERARVNRLSRRSREIYYAGDRNKLPRERIPSAAKFGISRGTTLYAPGGFFVPLHRESARPFSPRKAPDGQDGGVVGPRASPCTRVSRSSGPVGALRD